MRLKRYNEFVNDINEFDNWIKCSGIYCFSYKNMRREIKKLHDHKYRNYYYKDNFINKTFKDPKFNEMKFWKELENCRNF